MPLLLHGLDVCLMPYVHDERGQYRSPLKLYEYLAAGKPVVSTDHPAAQEFSDWVYIAKDSTSIVEEVAQALSEDSPSRQRERRNAVSQHSWDRRVDEMEGILQERLSST
jgi:glycosyltransferase involved in cell wall biosynthesis